MAWSGANCHPWYRQHAWRHQDNHLLNFCGQIQLHRGRKFCPHRSPGVRSLRDPLLTGLPLLAKQLTAYLVAPGQFKMLYEQAAPVKYSSGKGEFAGYWVTFQFDASFPTQSALGWTSYSCQTGHPFGEDTRPSRCLAQRSCPMGI